MKKFEISRINPYTVVTDLVQNAISIVLAGIIAFVSSFVFLTYVAPREYTSTMMLSVNLSGYTSTSTALSLARTVSLAESMDDIFGSDAMIAAAESNMGESVEGRVVAEQLEDTNLIKVSSIESSPEKAHEVLQTIADNHFNVTDSSFNNIIIQIISEPDVPTGPSNTISILSTCVLMAFVAALSVAVLIFLMSYMRDTIKNVSDIELELDGRLFGIVNHLDEINKKLPDAKRRLILTNSLVGYEFTESFRKMAIKIESIYRTKGHKTFMITSTAENEGKTTVSVNLATALVDNSHKVLIVDCDLKKPAVKNFFDNIEHDPNRDFRVYLDEGGDINSFIKHDPETGLYILDNAESCVNSAAKMSDSRFANVIEELKNQFDFIIIDTSPSGITVDAEIISGVADASLIVVRQDFVRVVNINDQIEAISKNYFAGCIFNNVHQLKALKENTVSERTDTVKS